MTERGFALAVGVYVLASVLGWCLVAVLIAAWWGL
jgi:hypothetical protein